MVEEEDGEVRGARTREAWCFATQTSSYKGMAGAERRRRSLLSGGLNSSRRELARMGRAMRTEDERCDEGDEGGDGRGREGLSGAGRSRLRERSSSRSLLGGSGLQQVVGGRAQLRRRGRPAASEVRGVALVPLRPGYLPRLGAMSDPHYQGYGLAHLQHHHHHHTASYPPSPLANSSAPSTAVSSSSTATGTAQGPPTPHDHDQDGDQVRPLRAMLARGAACVPSPSLSLEPVVREPTSRPSPLPLRLASCSLEHACVPARADPRLSALQLRHVPSPQGQFHALLDP